MAERQSVRDTRGDTRDHLFAKMYSRFNSFAMSTEVTQHCIQGHGASSFCAITPSCRGSSGASFAPTRSVPETTQGALLPGVPGALVDRFRSRIPHWLGAGGPDLSRAGPDGRSSLPPKRLPSSVVPPLRRFGSGVRTSRASVRAPGTPPRQ